MDLRFEWNWSKAKENFAKRGVSFELSRNVFKDPFALEFLDDREDYNEQRFVIIGTVDRQIHVVAYAERKDAIRIRSAGTATSQEQEIYL
jgi:uncharacterized DUF497 family protein